MKKPIIDAEFRALLPPLPTDEYDLLKADIQKNGLISAIVLWGDIIVDGHCRYAICQELGIEPRYRTIDLESRDDAIAWIINCQLGRKNLSDYEKVELAERKLAILERQAQTVGTALSEEEQSALAEYEKTIRDGAAVFLRVGVALTMIKQEKLYRDEFSTFEEYCRVRFGYSSNYARRMLKASELVRDLTLSKSVPTGTVLTERVVRPLSKLGTTEAQSAAFKQASEQAQSEGRHVTHRDVEHAVERAVCPEDVSDAEFQEMPPDDVPEKTTRRERISIDLSTVLSQERNILMQIDWIDKKDPKALGALLNIRGRVQTLIDELTKDAAAQ